MAEEGMRIAKVKVLSGVAAVVILALIVWGIGAALEVIVRGLGLAA